MKTSFQDGVDAIYNACVSAGSTPSSKTPDAIVNSLSELGNADVIARGGAGRGDTITLTSNKSCKKAFLVVDIVDDDKRSNAAVTLPGGSIKQVANIEYGCNDSDGNGYYTNFQIFSITDLTAGKIQIKCALGYGRAAVLIG